MILLKLSDHKENTACLGLDLDSFKSCHLCKVTRKKNCTPLLHVHGLAYHVLENDSNHNWETHRLLQRSVQAVPISTENIYSALILVSISILAGHSKFLLKTRNLVWKVKPKEEWLKFCCCQRSSVLSILFCAFQWDLLRQPRSWGIFKERGRAPPAFEKIKALSMLAPEPQKTVGHQWTVMKSTVSSNSTRTQFLWKSFTLQSPAQHVCIQL